VSLLPVGLAFSFPPQDYLDKLVAWSPPVSACLLTRLKKSLLTPPLPPHDSVIPFTSPARWNSSPPVQPPPQPGPRTFHQPLTSRFPFWSGPTASVNCWISLRVADVFLPASWHTSALCPAFPSIPLRARSPLFL